MEANDYAQMQRVLMDELRLLHYPIAIKYFFDAKELEAFKKGPGYHVPVKPLTFCQAEIGARMEGLSVLIEPDKLGCTNAKYVFGWKSMDEGEVKSHLKYTQNRDQAERYVLSKPRIAEGQLLAVAVAPLAGAAYTPDVVHFYCDSMQAYHLTTDWMAVMDVHPLKASMTANSAACGGNVYAWQEKTANVFLPCSGNYNAGKMERGEINVSIPGADLPLMIERLLERKRTTGGASITRLGDPYPGADICKNCPLIAFKKAGGEEPRPGGA
jgi:uncharacterized protein (DUF169 family)